MKYTEKYKVRWHDTDAKGRVRPTGILTYMQETANLQFVSHGRDLDDERREGKGVAFILSKMSVDIHMPLFAYDEIEVETFTCESRGYSFNRCFRILKDGKVACEAASVWALVDLKDGKLLRTDSYSVGFENEEMLTTLSPLRIRMAKTDEMETVGKRRIVYSDIDYNMHMNNTRYGDMLCDFMELDDVEKISGMTLSYLHEAAYGDELCVYRKREGKDYLFKTVNAEGKVCLEALVRCV